MNFHAKSQVSNGWGSDSTKPTQAGFITKQY